MGKSKVYFSCVMDDTYKGFTIDEKEFEEVLRREEFYSSKYISLSPIEEQRKLVKKLAIIRLLRESGFVSLTSVEEEQQGYAAELLSRFDLEETFSLPIDCMDMYLESMNDLSKSMSKLETSTKEISEYYIESIRNTELLEKLDMTLIPISEYNDKNVRYRLLDSKEKGKPYFKENLYYFKNRKIS